MNQKQAYIEFCQIEQSIPIFMQNGWLEAVCTEGDTWDVVLAHDEKNEIIGVLTYQIRQKWGLTVLSESLLSPFCGVWFKKKNFAKRHEQYHFEKKILEELIKQLPTFHFAHFRFSTTLTDWQPFFWAGFKQTTRYTYQLDLTTSRTERCSVVDVESTEQRSVPLFAQFNQNTQRNIRKAEKTFTISTSDDLDNFIEISNLTFDRQNTKSPIPYSIWKNADSFFKINNLRTIYFAQNTEGGIEAAIYIIFDKKTAYYLAGGATEMGRKQGAMQFLLHNAIEDARKQGVEIFDFEGSMLQGVEAFFRGFNGVLTPYFSVWKYKNRFLAFLDLLRKG